MIRNIEDVKKNKTRQRRGDDFSGYLTEEELLQLIEHVEAEELLRAPRQLKGNVFAQIQREKCSMKKRKVFVYRAKVLAALAAALAVLIFMPDDRAEIVQKPPIQQQAEDEPLAQMALQRQKNIDSSWEKYVAERERGGVRGFFEDINKTVTQFGATLYSGIVKQPADGRD